MMGGFGVPQNLVAQSLNTTLCTYANADNINITITTLTQRG